MQYCSINEAWERNKVSNQYKKYNNLKKNNLKKNIESFEPVDNSSVTYSAPTPENRLMYRKNIKNKRARDSDYHSTDTDLFHTTDTTSSYVTRRCSKLMKKIKNCKGCRKKLRSKFRPKIIEKLEYLLEDYKEVIVLILLGIALFIFINLIQNIVRK